MFHHERASKKNGKLACAQPATESTLLLSGPGNWEEMPPEMWLHILEYAGLKELGVWSQVSSWLHSLCAPLWEPLIANSVEMESATQVLRWSSPHVTGFSQKEMLAGVMAPLSVKWGSPVVAPKPPTKDVKEKKPKKKFGIFRTKNKLPPSSSTNSMERKLVFCGSGGVGGKSALIIQFIQGVFVTDYDPTIENNYRKLVEIDGRSQMLDMLDTAGQEEYSSMRSLWFQPAEGFMLAYDITSRSSFLDIQQWWLQILQTKGCHPDTLPAVLIGHKCDLEKERDVSTEEGKALAKEWSVPFFETSAKTNTNINECVFQLVREVWAKKERATSSSDQQVEVTNDKGSVYRGHVGTVDGLPTGYGVCTISQKDNKVFERYEGGWRNGKRHGFGTLYFRGCNNTVNARWVDGRLRN